MAHTETAQSSGFSSRGLIRDLVINAAIPVLLYQISKRFVSDSEVIALSLAAVVPLVASVVGVARHRTLNIIGIITLLGIAVSMVGLALGGDVRILLIRESFFTGALGIACFVSLLLPRPLMFYFALEFGTGGDPARIATMKAQYDQFSQARRVHRLVTIVWGFSYVGEFILRVILVLSLPTVVVLAISPIILTAITIATIAWTFAYVGRARRQAREHGVVVD